MNKDKDFILQLQAGQCISCGICAESCAYGAIRMGDFPEVDEELPVVRRLCAGLSGWSLGDAASRRQAGTACG